MVIDIVDSVTKDIKIIYKVVIQSMLMYGLQKWVMIRSVMWTMDHINVKVTHSITGRHVILERDTGLFSHLSTL